MNNSVENKGFKRGFKTGIILSLFAQLFSFLNYLFSLINSENHPGVVVHGFWGIGFPFSMYYGMYDIFHGDLNFTGLVGNIAVAIIFSFILGLIFKFVWSKSASRHLNLK
ncbi:MAG TPA: hypothetical protein VF604_13905 [Pyrinomonadaceae bacterium]